MAIGNVKIQLEEQFMSLKEQLRRDTAQAMRDGAVDKRNTLRMLMAAIKQVDGEFKEIVNIFFDD